MALVAFVLLDRICRGGGRLGSLVLLQLSLQAFPARQLSK